MGPMQNYNHCEEAGVTSGAGFIILKPCSWPEAEAERWGGEGGKAGWVAAGLGKMPRVEQRAAGTRRG